MIRYTRHLRKEEETKAHYGNLGAMADTKTTSVGTASSGRFAPVRVTRDWEHCQKCTGHKELSRYEEGKTIYKGFCAVVCLRAYKQRDPFFTERPLMVSQSNDGWKCVRMCLGSFCFVFVAITE